MTPSKTSSLPQKKTLTDQPFPATETAAALNPKDTNKEEQYIQEIEQSLSHFQYSTIISKEHITHQISSLMVNKS
jgi:hypothetical protein